MSFAMNEAQNTLQLFGELPNPDQGLFVQTSPDDFREFTLFPKLPVEIRLRIWRKCFPGPRTVHIEPGFSYEEPPSKLAQRTEMLKCDIPTPRTLQINSESRQETLRNYVIIPQSTFRSGYQVYSVASGPLCFDHKRDSIQASMYDAQAHVWLFDLVNASFPGCLEQIKHVEMLYLHETSHAWTVIRTVAKDDLKCVNYIDGVQRDVGWPFGGLFKFSGLQEIVIPVSFIGLLVRAPKSVERTLEEYRKLVVAFLELYKDEFRSGRIPVVHVKAVRSNGLYEMFP
ncbi:hypothetical protein EG329_002326 [Mollisiaceae sp. DMI_Dod_QoI]|nr:hypothetical protein EG329_002326 [Helotiales sp. DMI_Dod_QoI]